MESHAIGHFRGRLLLVLLGLTESPDWRYKNISFTVWDVGGQECADRQQKHPVFIHARMS
eukprot:2403812-Amphidinium_carterae.1